jgi:hypothetical protein
MVRFLGVLALTAFVGAGCAMYRFEANSMSTRTPLSTDCSVTVLHTPPAPPFEELGVIHRNVDAATNAEVFGWHVRSDVCRAGGNAVLARLEGSGIYAGGVVLYVAALDVPVEH